MITKELEWLPKFTFKISSQQIIDTHILAAGKHWNLRAKFISAKCSLRGQTFFFWFLLSPIFRLQKRLAEAWEWVDFSTNTKRLKCTTIVLCKRFLFHLPEQKVFDTYNSTLVTFSRVLWHGSISIMNFLPEIWRLGIRIEKS